MEKKPQPPVDLNSFAEVASGKPEDIYKLAKKMLFHEGVPAQLTVNRLVRLAAERGSAEAQYEEGSRAIFVPLYERVRWMKKAAKQGHVEAHTALGDLLLELEDTKGAIAWYEKGMALGSVQAHLSLSALYINGTKDQKRDYAKGFDLKEKVGDREGMVRLYNMIIFGMRHTYIPSDIAPDALGFERERLATLDKILTYLEKTEPEPEAQLYVRPASPPPP